MIFDNQIISINRRPHLNIEYTKPLVHQSQYHIISNFPICGLIFLLEKIIVQVNQTQKFHIINNQKLVSFIPIVWKWLRLPNGIWSFPSYFAILRYVFLKFSQHFFQSAWLHLIHARSEDISALSLPRSIWIADIINPHFRCRPLRKEFKLPYLTTRTPLGTELLDLYYPYKDHHFFDKQVLQVCT